MNTHAVNGNELTIGGCKVVFRFDIDNVKVGQGLYIVLLDIPSNVNEMNNVYAVNDRCQIVWQVQDAGDVYPIKNDVPYVGTRITEEGRIIVTNFNGVTYTLDPATGKIIARGTTK
jgi:outer membrane protein assembly factor BamB